MGNSVVSSKQSLETIAPRPCPGLTAAPESNYGVSKGFVPTLSHQAHATFAVISLLAANGHAFAHATVNPSV